GTLTIPAGTASIPLVLSVIGDQLYESNEVFYVYLSSPTNAVLKDSIGAGIIINDDPLIGVSSLTPATATVQVHEQINLALTWTHPQRWRLLHTVDLRIIDDQGSILLVRFDEPTNTFSIFNPASGKFGHPEAPGS